MPTTANQDRGFREFILRMEHDLTRCIAEELGNDTSWVVEWVTDNFTPEQVFHEDELGNWAEKHEYISKENISVADLHKWAEENGYVLVPQGEIGSEDEGL